MNSLNAALRRESPFLKSGWVVKPIKEIEEACSKSPFLYKRDWLGERAIPQGVIYFMFDQNKHVLNYIPDRLQPIEMYFAGDGGTTDATSIGCYIVCDAGNPIAGSHYYVLLRVGNWHYDKGNMAMSDQAKHIVGEFIPYMRGKYRMRESSIFIDPACKALRLEIEKLGLMTQGADNNAHDIKGTTKGLMCGIEMAQGALTNDRILFVDDDRYGMAPLMTEFGLYCTDDHGVPIDAYNHCCDEFRYGVNYFLKQYGLWN